MTHAEHHHFSGMKSTRIQYVRSGQLSTPDFLNAPDKLDMRFSLMSPCCDYGEPVQWLLSLSASEQEEIVATGDSAALVQPGEFDPARAFGQPAGSGTTLPLVRAGTDLKAMVTFGSLVYVFDIKDGVSLPIFSKSFNLYILASTVDYVRSTDVQETYTPRQVDSVGSDTIANGSYDPGLPVATSAIRSYARYNSKHQGHHAARNLTFTQTWVKDAPVAADFIDFVVPPGARSVVIVPGLSADIQFLSDVGSAIPRSGSLAANSGPHDILVPGNARILRVSAINTNHITTIFTLEI